MTRHSPGQTPGLFLGENMPILGQYLIDLSVSVMVGGSLALFFLAVSVGVLLMDGRVPPRWLWIAIAAIVILIALMPSQETARLIAGAGA